MVNDVEIVASRVKSMSVGDSSCSDLNNNQPEKNEKLKRHQSLDQPESTTDKRMPFEQFRSMSCPNEISSAQLARMRWQWAARNVKHMVDPWAVFNIDSFEAEKCIRHVYNPMRKEWTKDECVVKMEPKKFEQGAMRACFRLKKLSNTNKSQCWTHASNYVAKCYMDPEIPRERYFEDVKLQMDAKLWAEIYNQHNPPKKIDMFQMSILEFVDRDGSPLYHLEHFIDGNYTKYNSNSGFVEDAHIRFTPQAFSHFTFECSNHQLMVVDIQGVGDLYTDPQIHTAAGDDYGDGNLGLKGFALFFATHYCSDLCKSLGLTQFDLAPTELKKLERMAAYSKQRRGTQCRGSEEQVMSSLSNYFRHRIRNRSSASEEDSGINNDEVADDDADDQAVPPVDRNLHALHEEDEDNDDDEEDEENNDSNNDEAVKLAQQQSEQISRQQSSGSSGRRTSSSAGRRRRVRNDSTSDSTFNNDEAENYFSQMHTKKMFRPRSSCAFVEKDLMANRAQQCGRRRGGISARGSIGDEAKNGDGLMADFDPNEESILGKVHLEMCKYYECGRFTEPGADGYDEDAAFFHLEQAANLGVNDALKNIAKIYLQLPHTVLVDFKLEESDDHFAQGFNFMLECAEKKDKSALLYLAKAYDTGVGLSKEHSIDWPTACDYYQRVIDMCEDEEPGGSESGEPGDEPSYAILARMAEMYMKGGENLDVDYVQANELYSQAAEKATLFGKGRMANKYYMLAEEASGYIE